MENDKNEMNIYHSSNNNLLNSNPSKEDIYKNSQEHILSLRKKKNNKKFEQITKFNLCPQISKHKIDINELIPLIQNDPLYIKYNSSNGDKGQECILLQMLISENINILKYGLYELKSYLNTIKNSNEFLSKNLLETFNWPNFNKIFSKFKMEKTGYMK